MRRRARLTLTAAHKSDRTDNSREYAGIDFYKSGTAIVKTLKQQWQSQKRTAYFEKEILKLALDCPALTLPSDTRTWPARTRCFQHYKDSHKESSSFFRQRLPILGLKVTNTHAHEESSLQRLFWWFRVIP
jgi:hypothetical protein